MSKVYWFWERSGFGDVGDAYLVTERVLQQLKQLLAGVYVLLVSPGGLLPGEDIVGSSCDD